ncbi:MAG: PAS domain-containing protein [Deltaproteobacteria bacterium]|nr:PAS domain-containing protein [Deltaproteobacteria bacterium]
MRSRTQDPEMLRFHVAEGRHELPAVARRLPNADEWFVSLHQDAADVTPAESLSRSVLEGSDVAGVLMWQSNAKGERTYSNHSTSHFSGRTPDETLNYGWVQDIYPDDIAEYLREYHQAHLEGRSFRREYRIRHHNGTFRWVLGSTMPMVESGHFVGLTGVTLDIDELVSTRERLRRNEERLSVATFATRLGVFDWEIQSNRMGWDSTMFELFGLDPSSEKRSYEEWMELILPDDRERASLAVRSALQTGAELNIQFRTVLPTEVVRHIRVQAKVFLDDGGAPLRMVGTHADVTDAIETQSKIEAARRSAEEAAEAKSEFLANVSHEIRTPLNGIIGMTALLLDTELDDEQLESLETIKCSADNLLAVINDVLDFSKIEADRLELHPTSFEIRPALEKLLAPVRVKAKEKDLRFTISIAPDVPAQVCGDDLRIGQVVMNFVTNAVKFTPRQGSVKVDVSAEYLPDSKVQLTFSVKDTGIGMKPEVLDRVFDAFVQADSSITREFGGTGLGLAICRRLVNLMGGEIGVESVYGEGSSFSFKVICSVTSILPVSVRGSSTRLVCPIPITDPLNVLVVEDNPINQKVILRTLEKWGVRATLAQNGQEAVDTYLGTRNLDLILMDCQMPVMDGYEATAAIRQSERSRGRAHIPIIAVTAHAMEGDRENCLLAGMDDYLPRPIDRDQLAELMRKWCRVTSAIPIRHEG